MANLVWHTGYFYAQYAGNVVYDNSKVSRILLPDGILVRTNALTTNPPVFSYNHYVRDHLGNVRTVIDNAGAIKQVNNYYPFGMEHCESAETQSKLTYQDYLFGGKEFDRKFEVNLYDFGARFYDATRSQWTTPDPLAEKYYSISPYVYCANNPVIFVDPRGMGFDYSDMTKEEKNRYISDINSLKGRSKLFNALYTSLEKSKNVVKVEFGKTEKNANGESVAGQFQANNIGGGTITFKKGDLNIQDFVISEEVSHGFQNDNKSSYEDGRFNFEFEAKVIATAIGIESGSGYGEIEGMRSYQDLICRVYSQESNFQPSILWDSFIIYFGAYNSAANKYSRYNIQNNKGNDYYKQPTTITPISLLKLLVKTYE